VPIITQPTVRFECGGAEINMAARECWIFDTWRQHRVLNDATQSRVHLVVDSVGGAAFWDLVGQGRAHGQPQPAAWQPRQVEPDPRADAHFPLEAVNAPQVMSPWEMNSHFSLLFSEALPHPQLGQVQLLCAQLLRSWKGLWAQYGDSNEGKPQFRALMDRFAAQVEGPASALQLRNGVGWYSTLMLLVMLSAVNDGKRRGGGEYGIQDRA